jgi:diguanylate cyclase (GGDEF)-like protein
MSEGPAGRRALLFGATGIVAGAIAWLLASVLLGADRHELKAGVVPALVAIVLAAAVARLALRPLVHALRHSAAERERERRAGQEKLDLERRRNAALDRARRAERAWAAELRGQVMELHRRQGVLGHKTDDTRELVLRTAISALDAEKGLLLEREGEDEDRAEHLSLVCSEGFDHDPAESAVARRFAEQVIERDATVRENDPGQLEGRSAADAEIHNLVAIPIYLRDDFAGVVVCANREGGFDSYDDDVLLALGDHAGAVLHNERLRGELRTSYVATVSMLSDAIAAKDPFVGGHSQEVSAYVSAVAERLGVDPRRREELVFGSLLHDLGKIGISERILLKPGGLSPEERAIVELHPRIGYKLVSRMPRLAAIALAVLHHHERWDGTGYPGRLKGEQIPLEARIIGVADAFSAMTADRPYSRRRPLADACDEIERCAGTQFDPAVAAAFVEEVRRRPPSLEHGGPMAEALDDPELTAHRSGDERLLGTGSLAVIDNLTLLYSHRYFHEVAEAEAERAALQDVPFAVLMIRLEDLEEINLSDGYAAGDDALRAVGRVVQAAAGRWGDGTPSRYSGRRFTLLMPRATEQQAQAMLAELTAEIERQGRRLRTSVAIWEPGDSGGEVVGRARLGLELRPVGPA